MGREAMMSRRVDELQRQLEFTRHESQDRAAKATGARATELLAAEWATAAKLGLDAAKVRLTKTEAVLQKSLEALETERRARSKADQEVLTLRGQVLGAEESNARLLEKVTQQEEGLSILESTRLGMYLFCLWLMCWFFLSFASDLVVLFPELGGKIGSLERELETAKAAIGRGAEALAKSLEERHALEGELDRIRNVAQVVISEVFGWAPSTSTPAVQLMEVPNNV
jgi:hypothetical protein